MLGEQIKVDNNYAFIVVSSSLKNDKRGYLCVLTQKHDKCD